MCQLLLIGTDGPFGEPGEVVARGRQVVRQWRLIRLLGRRDGRTLAELARELSCATRTVLRDLEVLEAAGFPLYDEQDGKAKRWRFVEGFKVPESVPLTEEELAALAFGEAMARPLRRTDLHAVLQSAAGKLSGLIPSPLANPFAGYRAAIGLRESPPKRSASPRALIKTLLDAITSRQTLEVNYFSLNRGEETERLLDPHHLWWYEGALYLAAYCHDRRGVRTFAPERIRWARPTGESFSASDFSIEAYLQDSLGIFRGEPIDLTVRFRREVAPWVRERVWHVSQKLTEAPGGEIVFTARLADTPELRRWLLSFGSAAIVLEPPGVREAIRAQAEALLRALDVEEFLAGQLPLPLSGLPALSVE